MQLLLRLFLEHLRNNHSLEPNPVLSIYHLILQVEACSSPKLRQPLIRLSALKITALLLLSWVVSPFQRPALLAHSVLPAYNIVCFSKFLQMRSVSHKSCWNLLKGSALCQWTPSAVVHTFSYPRFLSNCNGLNDRSEAWSAFKKISQYLSNRGLFFAFTFLVLAFNLFGRHIVTFFVSCFNATINVGAVIMAELRYWSFVVCWLAFISIFCFLYLL